MKFRSVSSDGVSLCLYDWGLTTPVATVALIHGYGEYSGRYQHVAEHLNQNGIGVIAADLRGHGRSAGRRGYVRRFADYHHDVDTVLTAAKERANGKPLILMGHSTGGLISLDWQITRASDAFCGMVLSSPFLGLAHPPNPRLLRLLRLLGKCFGWLSIPSVLRGKDMCHDAQMASDYDIDPLIYRKGNLHWLDQALVTIEHAHANAAAIRLPLLLLYAGDDRVASANATDRFARALTSLDSTAERLPGLYHEILNEPLEGTRLLDRITKWILTRVDIA